MKEEERYELQRSCNKQTKNEEYKRRIKEE